MEISHGLYTWTVKPPVEIFPGEVVIVTFQFPVTLKATSLSNKECSWLGDRFFTGIGMFEGPTGGLSENSVIKAMEPTITVINTRALKLLFPTPRSLPSLFFKYSAIAFGYL